MDLPDFRNIQDFVCADFKAIHKLVWSDNNYVFSGFNSTGVGTNTLSIAIADAAFIVGADDGIIFIGAPSLAPLTTTSLTPSATNYVELYVDEDTGGADSRAFWDPTAAGGLGAEFSQIIDTFSFVQAKLNINTSNFTGDPDKVKICEVDVNGSGIITEIRDGRDLFFRLGRGNNVNFVYPWASRVEPADTQFTGADKDLHDVKDWADAVMTKLLELGGTTYWFESAPASIGGILQLAMSVLSAESATARFFWDGSELHITDDSGTPADADVLARLNLLQSAANLELTRQDGANAIALADDEVLWIEIPDPLANTVYDTVGVTSTNYRISTRGSVPFNDQTYWIAYRSGSKIYINGGLGELEAGESIEISDQTSDQTLSYIGATSDADDSPAYSSNNYITDGDSLTTAIGDLDAAIGASASASNFDRNLKLVGGGTWSWDLLNEELSFSADAYIQYPDFDNDRNRIPFSLESPITLQADEVAYVSINRTTDAATDLTVQVANINAFVPGANDVIIARRIGSDVIVGSHSFALKDGEYLELDGALAEINRLLGQLRIVAHETDANKLRIRASDTLLLDGAILSQELNSFIMDFDGAVIHLDTGDIFEEDDATPLGINFSPFAVPVGEYFWYGIALIAGSVGPDNRISVQVQVTPATASDAVAANAPLPLINGDKKLGAVRVFNNAGSIEREQIRRLGVGSGSGGDGAGSGLGDDINTLKFRASLNDDLSDDNAVNTSAGFTDSSLFSIVNEYFRLAYDATQTVTGTGTTNYILSGAPSFTVKAGDMLVVAGEARKITNVNSQTDLDIEAAFSVDPSASACTVAQAVHTVDLVAFDDDGDALPLGDVFSDDIETFMLSYRDSLAANDTVFDNGTPALIAFSASADGSSWTDALTRADSLNSDLPVRSVSVPANSFYLRFFPAATAGSGFANLLDYKAYLFEDPNLTTSGDDISKAVARTDGAGTEINCSVSSDTGKTRITTNFPFNESVEVYLDGKKIPEFVDATLTPDASFVRINANVIELDADYSGSGLQVEVLLRATTIDNSEENSSQLAELHDLHQAAFQGFVDESSMLTAINGAPGVGQFRTFGISGRASIPDLANDLQARMGIDRVMTQQIVELLDEFGSAGEKVFKPINDDRNLIRFVGNWRNTNDATNGARPQGESLNDYVEIVFYGTGLNLLTVQLEGGSRDWRVTIDGGVESGDIYVDGSSILSARNYAANQIVNVASGLSLGLHTVKIRNAGSLNLIVNGFEILNESSSVNLRPGTAYVNGRKLISSSASMLVYNSGFDSITREGAIVGSLGSRGARVVEYLKSDGSRGKSAYAVNAAQANLGSSSHLYEEVLRTHHWREFGAGRSDDFSTLLTSPVGDKFFTLDDGTTSLAGNDVAKAVQVTVADALQMTATNSFITITFVGTGLDVESYGDVTGVSDNHTFYVDGISVGTLAPAVVANQRYFTRIVSGLPYGTHTVKINRDASSNGSPYNVTKFIAYGPKKPSIPEGAVELADYNIMADFVANTTSDINRISTGILRKTAQRELVYVNGTGGAAWTLVTDVTGTISFILPNSSHLNTYVEYIFFGTGFDFRHRAQSGSSTDARVTLNGINLTSANYPSASFTTYPAARYNATTASLSFSDAGTVNGAGFVTSGLPLGWYRLRITNQVTGQHINADAFDVISPIHSPRSLNKVYENTSPVGSCSLSDSRQLSPVKSEGKSRFRGVAYGITQNISTTSTTFIPVLDLSLIVKSNGSWFKASYSMHNSNSANETLMQLFVNGLGVGQLLQRTGNTQGIMASDELIYLPPGIHKVDLYWRVSGGTGSSTGVQRKLTVEELD